MERAERSRRQRFERIMRRQEDADRRTLTDLAAIGFDSMTIPQARRYWALLKRWPHTQIGDRP